MSGRTSRQQRLLDMINLIYEIEDCDQMLATLFVELRHLLRFSSGVLLPIDPGTLKLQGAVCCDCPTENTVPYLEHYAAFDPYMRRDPDSLPLNRMVRLSDVASEREIDHCEFSDFTARVPYRQALAAVVGCDGQPLAAFSVHRRKEQIDFSADDAAVLDCIAPHLGRSLAIRKWVANPAQVENVALLAFGAGGQLLFMNKAAQHCVAPCSAAAVLAALPAVGSGGLRLGRQIYRVSRLPWRAASLLTCLAVQQADQVAGNGLGGSGAAEAETWAAAERLGARLTIVTLVPFCRRNDIRRRLDQHGLSLREIEITAQSILSGLANAHLADRLCISENTVKSHLRKAYRKIGVVSQRELIVKILGLQGDSLPSQP